MSNLRIGSVCSGYLGLDRAVHELIGGELAWVADNDKGASKILAHRLPNVPNLGDISAVDWSIVEPVDVVSGGFPCTDVSCAGARAGLVDGSRSGVWTYMARAIDALRPALVFIENVRGLLSAKADSDLEWCPWCMGDTDPELAVRALGAVLADLAGLGFDAEWVVLPASDVGAPHQRERVFILAWPAADAPDGGRHELHDGRQPRAHDAQRGSGDALMARDDRGSSLAAADAERDGPQGSRPAAREDQGRPGAPGVGCGPAIGGLAAQDTDSPASGERGIAAPGQAESGRSRADTGRPSGAPPAADAGDGSDPEWPWHPGRTQGQRAPERGVAGEHRDGPPADTQRDGCSRRTAGTPGSEDEPGQGSRTAAEGCRGGRPAADASGTGLEVGPVEHDGTERQAPERGGRDAAADPPGVGRGLGGRTGWQGGQGEQCGMGPAEREPGDIAWGAYEPAIRRWESVLGRPAPRPTEPGRTGERLSPRFVEWMMGLPEGWVTDVPGLSRNDKLKALGNGVVPQQAVAAYSLLLPAWHEAIRAGEAA